MFAALLQYAYDPLVQVHITTEAEGVCIDTGCILARYLGFVSAVVDDGEMRWSISRDSWTACPAMSFIVLAFIDQVWRFQIQNDNGFSL